MASRAMAPPPLSFTLDRASLVPVFRQLYDEARAAILSGRLAPGMRLPSTRALAADLGVSRTTVVTAFEQLLAEGYLEGRVGAGTFVARSLPDELLQPRSRPSSRTTNGQAPRSVSRRGALLAGASVSPAREGGPPRAFQPGVPALDAFPFDLWARLVARRYRRPPPELLGYGDPAGYRPLREAIAAYLRESRAVRCDADQVIVLTGAQQAIDLTARVLLDPGDVVWIEDPGYLGARGGLRGAGARLAPVPVDEQGLDIQAGMAAGAARLAYVTPSHQYPLGVTMSLQRRLALLEWASQADAWVLEDDYDSEYRYVGRPLAALHGLDTDGRVIYLGTFSKVLFPSLCLAYLVVPPDLVDAFVASRTLVNRQTPSLEQAALTDFITEGHFQRHIRRMRALYAERQAMLIEAARQELHGLLDTRPHAAGLHLVGWLPDGMDDLEAAAAAAAHGVDAPPLTPFALQPGNRPGLLLGYAAVNQAAIQTGVRRLSLALRAVALTRS